jgi:hypothetical protein
MHLDSEIVQRPASLERYLPAITDPTLTQRDVVLAKHAPTLEVYNKKGGPKAAFQL